MRASVSPLLVRVPLGRAREINPVVTHAGDDITCDREDWAMA